MGRGFMTAACAAAFSVAALASPAAALAAPGSVDDAGASDVDALMSELTRQAESLSVADCVLSCKALASMERARDRICELSPGARCEEARAKVATAREKVVAACPTCRSHAMPEPEPPDDAKASQPKPTAQPGDQASVQSEHARGGCASCRVAGERGGRSGVAGDGALLVLATLAIRRITRRRR